MFNKVAGFILSGLLCSGTIIAGCQKTSQSQPSQKGTAQVQHDYIHTNPSRWKPGDTVEISFPGLEDSTKWEQGSVGIFIPGSETFVIENSADFRLHWIPDSAFLASEGRHARVVSGFQTLERDTEFTTNLKYLIVHNDSNYYSFKCDSNYTYMDTTPLINIPTNIQNNKNAP